MKVGYSFEGLVNRVTAVDESAVHKTGDETVAGLKTFTSCPASSGVQGTAGTHLTRRDFVLAELNKKVDLTGAQTIGGAKTFSSNLTAPAFLSSAEQNTAANAATRKDYVDAELAKKLNLTGGTLTGNLTAPTVLVSSAQNTSANALTRKDYVDTAISDGLSASAITADSSLPANGKYPSHLRFMKPAVVTLDETWPDGSRLGVIVDHGVDMAAGDCIVQLTSGTISTSAGADRQIRLRQASREFIFEKIAGQWRVS